MNILNIVLILLLKIGQDVLFLGKIDAFNRNNRIYYLGISFTESAYAISVLSYVLVLMSSSYLYVLVYGLGAILGALISSLIKKKLDNKLEGQRKFFARITLDDSVDEQNLIEALKESNFDMTVEKMQYTSGRFRTVIQGSLRDRSEMWLLKDILRDRKGKHLVIMRAEDVYMIR